MSERHLPDPISKISSVFCGCGAHSTAWNWVFDYLERVSRKSYYESIDDGATLIAAYLMSHLGLTEHGSSIHGCWLTDAGSEALAFLNEHGSDWDQKAEWIDSSGLTWGYELDAGN